MASPVVCLRADQTVIELHLSLGADQESNVFLLISVACMSRRTKCIGIRCSLVRSHVVQLKPQIALQTSGSQRMHEIVAKRSLEANLPGHHEGALQAESPTFCKQEQRWDRSKIKRRSHTARQLAARLYQSGITRSERPGSWIKGVPVDRS